MTLVEECALKVMGFKEIDGCYVKQGFSIDVDSFDPAGNLEHRHMMLCEMARKHPDIQSQFFQMLFDVMQHQAQVEPCYPAFYLITAPGVPLVEAAVNSTPWSRTDEQQDD